LRTNERLGNHQHLVGHEIRTELGNGGAVGGCGRRQRLHRTVSPLGLIEILISQTATLFTVLLASVVLGERPTLPRLLGLALIVLGLIVAGGPALWMGGSRAWLGDLLFASAGLFWALFTVLQRRWDVAPFAATASVSWVSALIYGPLYVLTTDGHILRLPWLVLVEQVVAQGVLSGVVAIFAFSRAVAALGASRAALFPAVAPGVAILLGIPVTGEVPSLAQVSGLLILSAGLLLPLTLNVGSTSLRGIRSLRCRRPCR
jgi:drug/metabolite transporter (DMT)-like permease